MRIKLSALRLTSLFILSLSLIAYELAVMRTFSIGSWSNFGTMVISIALLGYGLAGTLLTFLEGRVSRNPDSWLLGSAFLLPPAMTAAYVLAQMIPFNPLLITMDSSQFIWIALYYVLYSIPFFVGAIFIGSAFIAFQGKIHQLYFWNMLGSGIGGFFILGLMSVLPPNRLIGLLIVLASAAVFFCLVEYKRPLRSFFMDPWKAGAAGLTLVVSILVLLAAGDIKVSEFKPISYARQFPDSRLVYHDFGPLGEYDAFSSSYFHFAPGLSDNASSNILDMPVDAFLGLYIDGDGPLGIMRRLSSREEAYIDYLPVSAPYLLQKDPRVLLLRLGGGIGAYSALYHNARHITVVEPNPALVNMLKNDDYFRTYTGDLLRDPRVELVNTEPRAYTESTSEKYDIVEISLIDSVGLSQTGGYPVTENFIYTAEAIASYLNCLDSGGMLSITVWNRLTPPRNIPKLLTTVTEAMRIAGFSQPEKHVFVFDLLLSTATILIKKDPLTQAETGNFLEFTRRMSFTPCYYPGMSPPARTFPEILEGYRKQLSGGSSSIDLIPEELYYYTLSSIFSGNSRELYSGFVFNIDPVTDDRPYYTAYVKPRTIPLVLKNIRDLSEEWGYLLLLATFFVSLLFGALIILVPAFGKRRELFSGQSGTFRVLFYFACLGLGYMLVEIFLLQRFSFFLVDPIYANSVVITAMLVISGFGSLVGGGLGISSGKKLLFSVSGITLSLLFYIFGLSPVLNSLLGLSLAAKIPLTVLFVMPAAFCLGIPFPTGLSALSVNRPNLIPWAWGVNGCLSVTGTVLARLVSISAGYGVVLFLGIFLYAAAYTAFIRNESFYS